MDNKSKQFLIELLTTPSPTGFETPIQRVVRDYVQNFAEVVEIDLHGNLMAAINAKASRKVMLAGHCDQIGFMVKHIDKEGFVYVSALGGIDTSVLLGAQIVFHPAAGPIPGIIGRKPIHTQKKEERDKTKHDLDDIWVDIGAKNKAAAQKKLQIGDCSTFKLGVTDLPNDFFCSPGLDDKLGLFVAMETLRACAKAKLAVGLYAVSTVQEEVGLRGARTSAFSIDPEVGIAIDVTHASDNPGSEGAKAIPCKLGAGPCISKGPNTNPVVHKMLAAAAKKAKVPHQIEPSSKLLGNDANAMQITRRGVATGSIGIPNRYMHTQVEMSCYKDLDNAVKLLTQFIKDIGPKTDFRPI